MLNLTLIQFVASWKIQKNNKKSAWDFYKSDSTLGTISRNLSHNSSVSWSKDKIQGIYNNFLENSLNILPKS